MGFSKWWMKHGLGSPASMAKTMTKCYLVNKSNHPSFSNEQLLALTLESRIQAQFQAKKANALQPRDEEGRNITELELIQKHNWDLKELILHVAHCEISEVNNACLNFPDLYQQLIEVIDETVDKILLKYGRGRLEDDAMDSGNTDDYRVLSLSQVLSMPNIAINREEDWGFFGYSTINHSYEKRLIGGDNVVVDHATGLMWHQSGSSDDMGWNVAKEWVHDLNSRGYAGYNDWRLPTVEEAASLLESSKKAGDMYIDAVFDIKLSGIWTGDENDSTIYPDSAWSVDFLNGVVDWSNVSLFYVRPVRFVK